MADFAPDHDTDHTHEHRPPPCRVRHARAGAGEPSRARGPARHHDGADIAAELFESTDLPDRWDRLDAFEGGAYRRTLVRVATADGAVEAWIYAAADAAAVMATIAAG